MGQSDQYVLEFDINDMDRGFTQNMVGGEIIIPKLYQIENETTTNEDVIVEEIVEVDFFEPEPDPIEPEEEPEDDNFVGGFLGSDVGLGGFS